MQCFIWVAFRVFLLCFLFSQRYMLVEDTIAVSNKNKQNNDYKSKLRNHSQKNKNGKNDNYHNSRNDYIHNLNIIIIKFSFNENLQFSTGWLNVMKWPRIVQVIITKINVRTPHMAKLLSLRWNVTKSQRIPISNQATKITSIVQRGNCWKNHFKWSIIQLKPF